jgi:signal transduction histidine kinase
MNPAPGGRVALRPAVLSLGTGVLLGAGWLAFSLVFLSDARSADRTRSAADRVRIELLECRRREKDFLLRSLTDPVFHSEGTTAFLSLHELARMGLGREMEELRSVVPAEESANVTLLLALKREYDESFQAFVGGHRRLGYNTWGIEGRWHEELRALERGVESAGRPELQRDLLLLKLAESAYLRLNDELSLGALQRRVDQLRRSIRGAPADATADLEPSLDHYLQRLSEYHATEMELGIDENLGLQGKFRKAAHEIEPIAKQLVDRAGGRYRTAIARLVGGFGVAAFLMTALLSTTFFLTRQAQMRSRRLSETAEALSRSNDELQQFAYVASHDLQEPLRAVAGCAQLLQQRLAGKLDDRSNELLGHAVEGAQRMQTLVDDLLALSRVGTQPAAPVDTDAGKALQAALDNLAVAVRDSRAAVTHDPLPTIAFDPTQLMQVFQNLIGNAIKFRGPRDPIVHVRAVREEKAWRFSVRDNGIGIEPQYFDKIFRVFQRLHTRRDYPGSGIGLAICKKILLRRGGRIWLESELNRGTTFYFTVPDRAE